MRRGALGSAPRPSIRSGHLVDGPALPGHFVAPVKRSMAVPGFSSDRRHLLMSKPRVFPALSLFMVATAGRNMTRTAYIAVLSGVAMMVLLTVDPAYEAAHHWVDAVLWACVAYFVFEWVVRVCPAFY